MRLLKRRGGKNSPLVVWGLGACLCLSFPLSSFAAPGDVPAAQSPQQQKTVKGTILDENGEPLIGVAVRVKGTAAAGAVTDFDGNFSLNVPSGAKTLEVSYIGYKTREAAIGNSPLTIRMQPDNKLLDEVMVIGYGTIKKRDLTGAVSSVSSDIIKLTPSVNPMEALQGRVAGLDITKESGEAGKGVNMQLRGNRSITASGSPLFIIDGMPGDYATLNPNDIESIEVLKDASSTAVYGSTGSNGVVIITTKKGEAGKMSVNFDTYVGFNGWSILPKMNSGEQWVNTRLLAQEESGSVVDDEDLQHAQEYLKQNKVVDWVDALMQTSVVQNYSLSLSGGTEKTQAYFSLNYSNERGQYKNDEYKVYSSTIRVNHMVNKWFTGGVHVQASYTDRERTYSKLASALRANPFGELYKEDGSVNEYPILDDNKQVNLLLDQNRDAYRNHPTNLRLYFQPYIRVTPIKGLTWESRLSSNWNYSKSEQFIGYGSYQFYDQAGTGALNASKEELAKYTSASIDNTSSWSYTWENILTYNFTIAKDHEFTLTGVTTYGDSKTNTSGSSAAGITSNTYYWTNLDAATGTKTVSSGYSMGKTMGYVARLNYSYLGRYLFSASVRHDGNSKLAKDVRWSTFPAVSAGWRISDERFMEPAQDWLSNLKIRAGYGETGAAGIDAYASWSILQQGIMGLGDEQLTSYKYPAVLTNPQLTWERSKNTNIGIDAGFLNNRIELTADYYITNTDGVIWKQQVPVTNGADTSGSAYFTMDKNIASTKNRGIELTLTSHNVAKKDFTWTSTLTFSKNKEKVTSLGEGAAEYITNGDYTLHIGDPVNSYFAYHIDGLWQYGEEADAAVFGKQPGDLKVSIPNMTKVSDGVWEKTYLQEDGTYATNTYTADNPYVVSDDDREIIGHKNPDWSLGFQNTFTWKDFDLSVYMYCRHGQMIYYEPITWYKSGGGAFPAHFKYWTSKNPTGDFPALNSARNWEDDRYYTSLAYVDGSFFKIKNITLGYTMPKSVCSKIGLSELRIYGTITNPLVKAGNHLLKDYDPEMGGGLDFPSTKQLVFGLNLSF